MNGVLTVPWKGINEIHGGDPEVSVLQAKPKQSLATQKSYIFDPNRYPFGVVLRSVQVFPSNLKGKKKDINFTYFPYSRIFFFFFFS